MTGMTIYAAQAGDLPAVLSLLTERAAWLRERGSRQWSGDLLAPERIAGMIERGGTYLAVAEDATPLGTITISDRGDPDFWTEAEQAESALYVSKMATSLEHRGLGTPLLGWAVNRAAFDRKAWVRLDVFRNGEAVTLRDWYAARGFTYLRDAVVDGKNSGALFQRPAGLGDPDAALLFCAPRIHTGRMQRPPFAMGTRVFADYYGPGVIADVDLVDAGTEHVLLDDPVRTYRVVLDTGRVVWFSDIDLEPIGVRV